MREDEIAAAGEGVGEQDLLHDAEHEAREARDEIVDMRRRTGLHLAGDVVIFDDRTGEELREEKHIKRIKRRALRHRRDLAVNVDEIGDLLEDDEGDADRQGDVGDRERREAEARDERAIILQDEARIFEIDEDREVAADAQRQPQASRPRSLFARIDPPGDEEIERDRGEDDEDEERLAPGVEDDARCEQHEHAGLEPRFDRKVKEIDRRREDEQKQRLVKKHPLSRS